jgi:hypothetical protein
MEKENHIENKRLNWKRDFIFLSVILIFHGTCVFTLSVVGGILLNENYYNFNENYISRVLFYASLVLMILVAFSNKKIIRYFILGFLLIQAIAVFYFMSLLYKVLL